MKIDAQVGTGSAHLSERCRGRSKTYINLVMIDIPRGKYIGKRVGEPSKDEAEHFMRCPKCNGWVDMRDLGQVFEHEGPLPHPTQDQPQ